MASESEAHEEPSKKGKCNFKYIWRTWLVNIGLILLVVFYTFAGAVIFTAIEAAHETRHKIVIKDFKEDIIEELRNYSNKNSDNWTMIARFLLTEFEREIWEMKREGITTYTEDSVWTLKSAMFYCWTLITTIGYGNIYPVTKSGQAITIAYSAIGIPLLLVVLANIGKAFTRMIKWCWKFFRRYYYTGSFRKAKKPDHNGEEIDFKVDEDFNLPITVAIVIWIVYLLIGSVLFCQWEDWSYFKSFYFCFISLSTIGLGDVIPENPVYMLLSSFYVVLGLTLTSMVINVIQEFMFESYKMAAETIVGPAGLQDYSAGVGKVKVILKTEIVPPELHVDDEPPITIKSEIVYFSTPPNEIPDIPSVFTKVFDEVEILRKVKESEISKYPIQVSIANEISSVDKPLPLSELHFAEQYLFKSVNEEVPVHLAENTTDENGTTSFEHIKQEISEILKENIAQPEETKIMSDQDLEEIKQENYEIIESTEEIQNEDSNNENIATLNIEDDDDDIKTTAGKTTEDAAD